MTTLQRETGPAGNGTGSKSQLAGEDTSTVSVQVSPPHALGLGAIHGIDGKFYPRQPMRGADRLGLIGEVHSLAHDRGLSIREVIRTLQAQRGIRRSVGSVSSYLNDWTCQGCSGRRSEASEQRTSGGEA